MALRDINNLTPEMRSAAEPSLPIPNSIPPQGQDTLSAGPDTSAMAQPDMLPLTPNATGPGSTALGGALQDALSKPTNGVPLDFNARAHAATNAAAEATPPAQRNAPGAWARQLISGAQAALSGAGQDYAEAKPAPNSGIFGGFAAVQQPKAARQQATKE